MENTVTDIIAREAERQSSTIELIASENHVSPAVMEAVGSCLTNKYAEGYPGKRYYGGCQNYDEIEQLAQERAKQLFGCAHTNVQPHSGASANIAAFFAFMQPGDKYASLVLSDGGHLSHGLKINISGKYARFYRRKAGCCRLDHNVIHFFKLGTRLSDRKCSSKI